MIINDLIEKKIVFLGIDFLSIDLIKFFVEKDISFKIVEKTETISNYFLDNKMLLKEHFISIDDYDFDKADYILLTENFFKYFDKYEILQNKFKLLMDNIFLQEEFISQIFNEKKIIGVFGKNQKYFFYDFFSKLYEAVCGKNIICSLFSSQKNIDCNTNDIILLFLNERKIKYIKTIQFNKIVLLSFEHYNQNDLSDSVKNYVLNKQKINSEVLFNLDDLNVRNFYEDELKENKLNIENKVIFSTTKLLENGYSFINGTFYNYCNGNNLSYNIQKSEIIKGYIKESSILSSFIILQEYFDGDKNLIIENIEFLKNLSNNMEYLGQIGNIHFISNLLNITEILYLEPIKFNLKNYYINVINNENNFLSDIKNHWKNEAKFFAIDSLDILDDEVIKKLKLIKFNELEDCFVNVKQNLLNENKEENIIVVLTSTENIGIEEVNKYDKYINRFKKLMEDLKNE